MERSWHNEAAATGGRPQAHDRRVSYRDERRFLRDERGASLTLCFICRRPTRQARDPMRTPAGMTSLHGACISAAVPSDQRVTGTANTVSGSNALESPYT